MKYQFITNSPEETERVGEAICRYFKGNGKSEALIALCGEMGVGKTAFVRGFCRLLGIRSVKSPTYTVVNAYAGEGCRVYHFDTYRIEGEEDLYSIGFEDYLRERDAYCLVEWSERVEEFLPREHYTVSISRTDGECGRMITFTLPEGEKEENDEALSL